MPGRGLCGDRADQGIELRFAAGAVRLEAAARDGADLLCPERGLRIVAGGVCIREAIAGNGRGTGSAVGDCGSLRAGAGRVRGKAAVADTADDAGFGCPKDGVIVVSAFRNIRKRARGGLRLSRWTASCPQRSLFLLRW